MPGSNDRNRTIYQRLAAVYDLAARVPPIAHPRTRLFTLAGIQPGQRVLVVGVGTGQDLAHLPAGTEVTGIDLSPAMLARARARGTDATLREMNALSLTATIAETPLRVSHHETGSRLADIIQLTPRT
jgi:phosphatidylethanolamine/phosphatidyl-N-methylethanolamine N-methyltransferase